MFPHILTHWLHFFRAQLSPQQKLPTTLETITYRICSGVPAIPQNYLNQPLQYVPLAKASPINPP